MPRTRINIDFGHMTESWITKTARRLGITRTELCRQIVINAMIYGIDDNAIVEGARENRELANQARALSQSARHHPPQR